MLVGNTDWLQPSSHGAQHGMMFLSVGDITQAFILHLPSFSHKLKRKELKICET